MFIPLVPGGGFEPPRETPHAPQACASAKFRHPGRHNNTSRSGKGGGTAPPSSARRTECLLSAQRV